MGSGIETYINILGNNAGALSAISALQSLDASTAKSTASIKALESQTAEAAARINDLKSGKALESLTEELRQANERLNEIKSGKVPFDAKEYKRASDEVGKLGVKLDAAKSKNAAALDKEQQKAAALVNKTNEQKAAYASTASLVAAKRNLLVKSLDDQTSKLGQFAQAAKEAGGPLGSIVGKVQSLGKGGAVGAAIALVLALAALATGAIIAAAAMAKYALTASDAARSNRLLSESFTGSAARGQELETVVDQMTNKFPALIGQTRKWGHELADVNILGRDAQRVMNTMGIIASARSEQAANKIKGIAEASRNARVLMIGARDQFGEFTGLAGTGIKAADIYAAVAQSMGKSIPEAKRMVNAGIVPMRKGLEALELAAQTKFGPIVAKQMMSLETQSAKLRENIARLFSGANIDKFLEGLKTVTDLFDTNTVMGYALREVFTAIFTKVADVASRVFPYVRAAVLGVAFGVIMLAAQAKQLYKQFQQTFGGVSSNVNGIQLAFKIGIGIVGMFVGSIAVLTAAFALLGVTALVALAPLWIPFALAAVFIYAMVKAITAVIDEAESLGKELEEIDLGAAAENIMNSLIDGIKAKIADVKAVITDVGSAITGAFDTKMEIKSPSRAMKRRANYVVDPLVTVPEERASEVENAITMLAPTDGNRGTKGASMPARALPSGPTFSFTNCNFGSMTREDVQAIFTGEYLAMARGYALGTG